MKTFVVAALLAVAAGWPQPSRAAESAISVAHPWLRATPKHASVAVGYATITNHGDTPDTLLAASLPMAREGQVHTMAMSHGVMTMRRLDGGLPIAPGATVTLGPGGDHLMFVGLDAPLKEGETMQGSLQFAKAGRVNVFFAVAGIGARTAPGTRSQGTAGVSGPDAMPGMDMGGSMHGMH